MFKGKLPRKRKGRGGREGVAQKEKKLLEVPHMNIVVRTSEKDVLSFRGGRGGGGGGLQEKTGLKERR